MKPRRYLFVVNLAYAFPVMRPLQRLIRERGEETAWFIEEQVARAGLQAGERELSTVHEVMVYAPDVVFTCSDDVYDFFPGIKVKLFHGYPINKRNDRHDAHFRNRGWFDIYCTQGPSSTLPFRELERKCGTFRVYETGWPKADLYFSPDMQRRPCNSRPVVLYSATFTRSLTSAPILSEEIGRLVGTREWDWIFMFHPKFTNAEVLERYERIAKEHGNASYLGNTFDAEAMRRADVMLCDSSSVILEFMFLDKPVVTFRNSHPGPFLLDVTRPEEVEAALEKALTRPAELMEEVHKYTLFHEPHRDGRCAARVIEAVDDFLERGYAGLKRKPLNLVRKWKMRRKMHYFPLLEKLKHK